MSLKERIEDNLTLWLLGTLFAGFMAGIGAYQAILEIAQLEVVSRAKLDQLEGVRSVASKGSEKMSSARQLDSEPAPEAENFAQPATANFKLSSKLPFPEHLDTISPGMRISEARTVFPNGQMTSLWYAVDMDSGPFSRIAFFVFENEEDPKIAVVNFQFRDASSKRAVLAVLLRELGKRPHQTKMLGERIVWPNVDGYELTIDQSYAISLTSAQGEGHE